MIVNTLLGIFAALIIAADVAALPAQLASPHSSAPIIRNVSDAARPSSGGCFMTAQGGPSAACVILAPSAAQEARQTAQGAILPPSSGDAGLAALRPVYAAQGGPFDVCPVLTRVRFDYDGPNAGACGLAEDTAWDVWAYFNVRPYESAATFARWHDSDPANALRTAEIERWIVTFAASSWAAAHYPQFAQGEIGAALSGFASWQRGGAVAPEWIDAYGRYLRP